MKEVNEKQLEEFFEKSREVLNEMRAIPKKLKALSDELEKVIKDEATSGTESEENLNELSLAVSKTRQLAELYEQFIV